MVRAPATIGGRVSARLTLAVLLAAALAAHAPAQQQQQQQQQPADEAVVAPSELAPQELSIEDYASALAGLQRLVEGGDWDAARRQAEALRGVRVHVGRLRFEADPCVLAATSAVRDGATAARAIKQLRQVLASLDRKREEPALALDPERLTRLAQEQAARRPQAGGEVDVALPGRPLTVPEQLRRWLVAANDWLWKWLGRLWDWLLRSQPRKNTGIKGTRIAVGVLVAAIAALLAVAAVVALRRREAPEAGGEAEGSSSERDENPLSREADEWERYAAELAASGRRREAIRAWYHAVLVALFRAGRLHHQKGRTNWEYVAELGPEAAWRPGFIRLTETFDREWYGRETSGADTLREHAGRAKDLLRAVRGEARPDRSSAAWGPAA